MNRIIFACFVLAVLIACNNSDSKKDKTIKATEDISQNPDYQKGLALVAKNKCLTCHAIEETITGPPYQEVANKYAGMSDTIITHLAGKIINGGNGIWGEIFMTPHPDVSQEDAEAMVKYILLLKK